MPGKHGQRILVTGGFGYAGGFMSARFAESGYEVFVLSRRREKPETGFACAHISADLSRLAPHEIAPLLPEGLDGVVHAANLNDDGSPEYPKNALLTNAFGLRALLDALRLRAAADGAAPPPLVYCSTFHVYGAQTGLIDEESPLRPGNDYALTHFFAEEYCRFAMRTKGGPPCIILRLSNGYGAPRVPGSMQWRLLLNDLCRSAVEHGELRLRSDPSQPRDFIWLEDAARAAQALLAEPRLAGRAFNAASGAALSIGEAAARVARIASETLGRDVPLICGYGGPPGGGTLRVSNEALRAATGLIFQDRLDEEIRAVLALALAGRA